MKNATHLIQVKRKTAIYIIVGVLLFAIATPVLADYLGPDRTVTQATSTCKVVLYECQYIASKDAWKYHKVDNWSCSNESQPWKAYSGNPSSQGCFSATSGDKYWSKEEVLQTVTVTHPPATISNSLLNCNLNNGWCNTAPALELNGIEPLSGYNILAIEGSLNGQTFACPDANCSIPLSEGTNDFTFWALSSWGDSSKMGNLSAQVDTIPPTLGLDINASNGTNGWYVSQTSVTAAGSDSTSGLSSVFLSANNGPWELSTILDEGVHNIDVQAQDNAGNTSNTSSVISVDTTTPSIDLSINGITGNEGWYISNIEVAASAIDATSGINTFEVSSDGNAYLEYMSPITLSDGFHMIQYKAIDNAGNETQTPQQEFYIDTAAPVVDLPATWNVDETIIFKVQDDGSGLASLRVVIEDEDERYAKVAWNESVSGAKFKGEITWDGIFKDGTTALPGEYLVWIKTSDIAGNENFTLGIVTVPSPVSPFQFIPAGISPAASPKPPKELFDENENTSAKGASSPAISFGGTTQPIKETEQSSFSVSPDTPTTTTANSNVLWGAAAATTISAVALYAHEEKKKREEEAARNRAEIEARIAEQKAQKKAAEQARKIAQWFEGQAILKAQAEERKMRSANNRVENKEIYLEKEMRARSAKPQEWNTASYRAYMSQKAMEVYRAQEKAASNTASPQKNVTNKSVPTNWWEKVINVIDKNQTLAAVAVGVTVGIGAVAIIATGGIATPLVVGGALLLAGGLTAGGTAALNVHYDRPLNENMWKNVGYSAVSALATIGIGMAVTGSITTGTVQQALYRGGNAIAGQCMKHPIACGRITAGVQLWDKVEDLGLQAKLAFQTARGDPRAADTVLELQLEKLDNTPGNTTFREIYETAVELFSKKADEAAQIASTLTRLGADAQIDKDGLINLAADTAPEVIEEIVDDLKAIPGRNVWVSGSTIYINSPTQSAMEAVSQLKTAVANRADEKTINRLIDQVAAATTHGNGQRLVLGAWEEGSGYIGDAVENGGVFFDTGDEVWEVLKESGIDPWRVNEAVMQQQLKNGVDRIDFVSGDIWDVLESAPENSYRVKEITWLLDHADDYGYELVGNSWIKIKP